MNEDLPETVGEHVLSALGRTVTDIWHLVHALEAPTDTVVDTLRLPPIALELAIAIALVPGELLRSLLNDLGPRGWCDGHGSI